MLRGMSMRVVVEEFMQVVNATRGMADLATALSEMTRRMGFRHFALTHHVDVDAAHPMIRLHTYPDRWVEYFDRNRLSLSDPVHRVSQRRNTVFRWSQLSGLIQLTPADHELLELARGHGLVDGFTVPANVAGEAHGSCSFAVGPDTEMPDEAMLAQLAGLFAFEGARRIWLARNGPGKPQPRLTDRQRDCLIWAARGKTDWEISRILGISQETVVQHLKQARDRYGVQKRTSLLIRALFNGTIGFTDIFAR